MPSVTFRPRFASVEARVEQVSAVVEPRSFRLGSPDDFETTGTNGIEGRPGEDDGIGPCSHDRQDRMIEARLVDALYGGLEDFHVSLLNTHAPLK